MGQTCVTCYRVSTYTYVTKNLNAIGITDWGALSRAHVQFNIFEDIRFRIPGHPFVEQSPDLGVFDK